jgi:large subunit ribosomal protein L3
MARVGIIGRKVGMTRVFDDTGVSIPVTVVEAEANRITQIKNLDVDGYQAIQVTAGQRKKKHLTKSLIGHYAKAEVEAGRLLAEFRLSDSENGADYSLGQDITVEIFSPGQIVDVTGISKGKGFAGTIKRHNFKGQDATHGNSLSHRVPGSIGQNQTPGKVFKGKKMAGQMGNKRTTVQNLQVVRIDPERNLILIKGGVPGAPGGDLIIKPAVKKMLEDK